MDRPTFDIIISGAGPVGCALALLLAARTRQPHTIALAARGLAAAPGTGASTTGAGPGHVPDPRTLALNHGSRSLLESLDAWPRDCADITTVHVSQQRHAGRCVIRTDDLGVARLGSVVTYEGVLERLRSRLTNAGITLLDGPLTNMRQLPGHVRGQRGDGAITARVMVRSDGHPPRGLSRDYGQHAVLATARSERRQPGWAFERFTAEGPLALLPHPQDDTAWSIVWCCTPERARALAGLAPEAFDAALNTQFGARLGQLASVGERHVFPLSLHVGASLISPHQVAIGNAAQTLHPVAGQGLNLGLRDAAQLAQALSPWLAQPQASPEPALQAYARLRRRDRGLTVAITDTLPRLFTTGNGLVNAVCGMALGGLDLIAPARHLLARHLLQGLRR